MKYTLLMFFIINILAGIYFAAQLTVTTEGNGYVSSVYPSGILCGYACSETYSDGTEITLRAIPNEGYSFIEWGGACSGSDATCVITLQGQIEVTARFSGAVLREYQLTVYKSGDGQGRVVSDPFGISLGIIAPYDSASFAAGSEVMLTAIPAAGSSFGGWSGACTGKTEICSIVMDRAKEATAFFVRGEPAAEPPSVSLPPPSAPPSTPPSSVPSPQPRPSPQPAPSPPYSPPGVINSTIPQGMSLSVTKLGSGAVVSRDRNISCGSKCSYNYEKGSTVTLEAVPSAGYVFGGWEGCDTKEPICVLTIKRAKKIRALFFPSRVQLSVSNSGGGYVTSPDHKIFCSPYCIGDYLSGSEVKLTAVNSLNSIFRGWGGACSGTKETCTILINGSANVSANFEIIKPPEYLLTVSKSDGGEVISSDSRINCGTDCNESYKEDETVTLVAKPLVLYHDAARTRLWYAYSFEGWGGACIGQNLTCTVDMDAAKRVVANFKKPRTEYILTVNALGRGSVFVNTAEQLCPGLCSKKVPINQDINLTFVSDEGFTVAGWMGPCNFYIAPSSFDAYGYGVNLSCVIPGRNWSDISINVTFIKHPDPSDYRLYLSKSGSGKGEIAVAYQGVAFTCGHGQSECSQKLPKNTRVTINAKPDPGSYFVWESGANAGQTEVVLGSKFKGWRGDCSGSNTTCMLTMESVRNATAVFVQSVFYNLTVLNNDAGVVIRSPYEEVYGYYGYKVMRHKIVCGLNCEDKFESESVVKLTADKGVAWTGCDSVAGGACIVTMNGNRVISADLSAQEKSQLVKQALTEYFSRGEYGKYDLSSYVQSEQNAPFRHTLDALTRKEMKGNVNSIKDWIERNKAWFLNEGGIQATINAKMKDIVKQALLAVFASEVSAYPALRDFLIDENQKPFQTALLDLKEGRNGGTPDGLKSWIQGAKDWYLSTTGIRAKIEELKPKPPPPPAVPSISSISPEGRQIGRPAVIKGANFRNIQQVSVGSDIVAYNVVSESEIVLPYVTWGMGPNPTVTVQTNGGRAWAPLIYNAGIKVEYNANGKTEECFGGVGKGCGGLTGGNIFAGSSRILAIKAGCEGEEGGYRRCWVASGSIRHDNCCVRYPGGKHCGGPGTDGQPAGEWNHNNMCVSEWDAAFWDVFWGRAWEHSFKVGGYTPDLTPASYSPSDRYMQYGNPGEAVSTINLCAQSGHELRQIEDYGFCCSGSAYISSKKCV